ncbi:MAG: flagellar basal body rod protein FlgB [Gammaproteobacteria bacterium]|nr:flagellar basal body rod protein FlgB [Gammaproteobacteria bacterium]
MSNIIDDYLGTHATALTLRAQRASLLANNVANADTPNYKARDIDFGATLQQQLSAQTSGLQTTHAAHIDTSQSGLSGTAIKYRVPQQASLDGNTVDSDVENGKFAENAVRYQASLEFLGSRISGLINILKGE